MYSSEEHVFITWEYLWVLLLGLDDESEETFVAKVVDDKAKSTLEICWLYLDILEVSRED